LAGRSESQIGTEQARPAVTQNFNQSCGRFRARMKHALELSVSVSGPSLGPPSAPIPSTENPRTHLRMHPHRMHPHTFTPSCAHIWLSYAHPMHTFVGSSIQISYPSECAASSLLLAPLRHSAQHSHCPPPQQPPQPASAQRSVRGNPPPPAR